MPKSPKGGNTMAVLTMNVLSRCLMQKTDVRFIIPTPTLDEMLAGTDKYDPEEKFPVVYLLHGAAWDGFDWISNSQIEALAQKYRFIAVIPNCGLSFYNNVPEEERYFDFVADELPQIAEALFHASRKPEDRYIAGISMGGYGSMRIGLTYPERYAKIGCLSGCLDMHAFLAIFDGHSPFNVFTKFGDWHKIPGSPYDVTVLAKQALEAGKKIPPVWNCIGTEDMLYKQAKPVADALIGMGLDYTYVEGHGMHDWNFWNPMLEHGLFDFFFPEKK